MTQPKRGLGRGLDALFPGGGSQGAQAAAQPPSMHEPATPRGTPERLDIDLIAPNPEQPRTHFEPEKLRELADSIREHGILQPLVVTRDGLGGYRLIAGERRLQAARLAGLRTVPIVLREAASTELLELALIENVQRADLNPIEEALAYRRLTEELGLTQEDAARRVGKSRTAVANTLRLLQLEPEIRRSIAGGELSEGHGRALLGAAAGRPRLDAWNEVVKRGLNVRQAEALVRRQNEAAARPASPAPAPPPRRASTLGDTELRLRRRLSTRVTVTPQGQGARIVIDAFGAEELDHVLAILMGDDA